MGGEEATGLVGGEPRGTVTDADLEGNEERRVDRLHRRAYELGHLFKFGEGDVEVQFIVHLQDHATMEPPLADRFV